MTAADALRRSRERLARDHEAMARFAALRRQLIAERAEKQQQQLEGSLLWSVGALLHQGLAVRVAIIGTNRRRGSWRWRKACLDQLREDREAAVDVRERLSEELRPGVFAMWADPREWAR